MENFLFEIYDTEPAALEGEDTRKCSKCHRVLPRSNFGTSGSKEGIRTDCKKCCSARNKLVRELKKKHPKPSTDYMCPICNRLQEQFSKSFSLDHSHATGRFRGWLCHNCNTALGLLGDDIQVLQKAINYLSKDND